MHSQASATPFALTRGQPIITTAPTGYTLVDLLRDAGFTIDQRRLDRVFHDPKGPITGKVTVTATPTEIQGLVKGVYHAVIRLQGGQVTDCDCDCPDWFQSGGKAARIPCKHILGTAVDAPWPIAGAAPATMPTDPTPMPTPPATPTPPSDPDTLTFNQRVRRAIGQAVARLADLVEPILQADKTPFLIGPTDVAKTSAIRLVAMRHGWAFEALDGMSSYADADLVGLKTDHGVYASVIARAFRRARSGECVLLFLDELTRLNQRAMDVLMRPLLPIPCEIAWAQRVPADDGQTVRMVEVPDVGPRLGAGQPLQGGAGLQPLGLRARSGSGAAHRAAGSRFRSGRGRALPEAGPRRHRDVVEAGDGRPTAAADRLHAAGRGRGSH